MHENITEMLSREIKRLICLIRGENINTLIKEVSRCSISEKDSAPQQ